MCLLFLLSFGVVSHIFIHKVSANAGECSALNSYVGVTSPSNLVTTMLSAEALFEPYSYFISPTETVILSNDDKGACLSSSNELITDVTNKIVMVRRNDGNCSEHYKVSILENGGAEGVLIANDEDGNYVETIVDDNSVSTTSIPTRMITQEDGDLIINYLSSGSNNGTLEIEFGCLDGTYPSVLCVVDTSGEYWWIDGDYQQEGVDILTWNSHPVFIKESYYGLIPNDLYIFLDNLDGDEDWRWTIGYEYNLTKIDDDDEYTYIEAFCNETGILDPADCSSWLTWDKTHWGTWSPENYDNNNQIGVSDDLCQLADSYICMESTDYSVGGITGTYKLITKGYGLWTRELSYSDMAPGFLVYTRLYEDDDCPDNSDWWGCFKNGFLLYDAVDYYGSNYGDLAYCMLGTDDEMDEYPDNIEFMPWLCENWYVVEDGTTDDDSYVLDSSFIVVNGTCQDYDGSDGSDTSTVDDVNDDMCLSDHQLLHSFLQGSYSILDGTTSSGRHVWYLPKNDESDYPAYLYYHGDFDEDEPWWVLGQANPIDVTVDDYQYAVYAYCAADVNDPRDCGGCWNFYYGSTWFGDYDTDCDATFYEGSCDPTTTLALITDPSLEDEYYPEEICASYATGLAHSYAGTYERSQNTIDGRYYYTLTIDVYGASEIADGYERYFVYDNFFKYWNWGSSISISGDDTTYFCTGRKMYNPTECETWYYGEYAQDGWSVTEGACTEYVVTGGTSNSGSSNNSSSSDINAGETAGLVVTIVILVVCIIIGALYYRQIAQKNAANNAVSFRDPAPIGGGVTAGGGRNTSGKSKHGRQQSDMIELGDDNNNGTTGGYNMETLNNEDLGEEIEDAPAPLPQNGGQTKGGSKHSSQPSDLVELGDGNPVTGN